MNMARGAEDYLLQEAWRALASKAGRPVMLESSTMLKHVHVIVETRIFHRPLSYRV